MDLLSLLRMMIQSCPREIQEHLALDVIGTLCITMSALRVEDDRSELASWEGNSPQDVFDSLAERVKADGECPLPDAENMVERWLDHIGTCPNHEHEHGPSEPPSFEVPDRLPDDWH